MTGGVHIAQFQFYMMFTLLSTKTNELVHNLKPTQFAILVTAWQARFRTCPMLCTFSFDAVVTHSYTSCHKKTHTGV